MRATPAAMIAGAPDSSPIVLRPAQPDDALCLSVLAMQVFLDTYATEGIRPSLAREVLSGYSAASFSAAIGQPAVRLWLAERLGHVVGFAQVTLGERHALAPPGVQAELLRLYVQSPSPASSSARACWRPPSTRQA